MKDKDKPIPLGVHELCQQIQKQLHFLAIKPDTSARDKELAHREKLMAKLKQQLQDLSAGKPPLPLGGAKRS